MSLGPRLTTQCTGRHRCAAPPVISKVRALNMQMDQLLEQVQDPESFLRFVVALQEDRIDEEEWENATIQDFLGASIAWAKDSDWGARQGLSSESVWKQMAVFLYMGKVYE